MFSAADLIDVLRARRTLRSIRPEAPGQLPEGWRRWLEAMPVRRTAVTGAPAQTFVDTFLARSLRMPVRAPALLGRWHAFSTLWRQQWSPPARDERGMRITGMATSITLHLLLSAALVWLMDARFLLLPPVPEPTDAQVVQVEFIGRGTTDAEGGAEAPAVPDAAREARPAMAGATPPDVPDTSPERPEAEAADDVAPEAPRIPEREVAQVAPPRIEVEAPPVPDRPVPPPVPPQPLAVGEQPRPDDTFLLPPPTPRVDDAPVVRTPELVAEIPAVPVREVPEPVAAPAVRGLQEAPRIVATVPTVVPTVRERTIAAPEPVVAPDFSRATRPETTVSEARIAARIPEVSAREVPAPASDTATARDASEASSATRDAAPADAASTRASDSTEAQVADAAAPPTTSPGTRPDSGASARTESAPGRGPDPAAAPGAWATTVPGDDWGDAARDRPGTADGPPGLFDGEGRPRLADSGLPPGTFEENVADFGNAGEWMQRPAFPYEPTRFDRFWIPGGTLLEEWVRRGIRELLVPIPGTSKRLKCVVSVLQLGGGCWISDPNLNEQPSSGRPAPDVPFRPDLFEDPGVLEQPPPGG